MTWSRFHGHFCRTIFVRFLGSRLKSSAKIHDNTQHTPKTSRILTMAAPFSFAAAAVAIASAVSTIQSKASLANMKAMKSSCLWGYFWVQRIVLILRIRMTTICADVHNVTVIQQNIAANSATLQSTKQQRGDVSLPFGLNMSRCSESLRCTMW